MEKILISKCLLGENVRYDGGNNSKTQHPLLKKWFAENRLLSVCPEVQAGLPIPRPASEIIKYSGRDDLLAMNTRVLTEDKIDVTDSYRKGAEIALSIAVKYQIKVAVLKDGSPSCGSSRIYDGTFTNTRISGEGFTTALLCEKGIRVFNENQLEELENYLDLLEENKK